MKRTLIQFATFALLIGAVAFAPGQLQAQDASTNSAPAPTPSPRPKVPHFRGTLNAVDLTAKTITVGKFTYQITSETKIYKDRKPATLEDAKMGDLVRGAYKHDGDNRIALRVAFMTPPPPASATPPPSAPTPPPNGGGSQ